MQHPDPNWTGARGADCFSFGDDQQYKPERPPLQARPLGPGELARLNELARLALREKGARPC